MNNNNNKKSYNPSLWRLIALERKYMLLTIVLSLLAVWLTILIGCQLIGMYMGYKFFRMIAEDKGGK